MHQSAVNQGSDATCDWCHKVRRREIISLCIRITYAASTSKDIKSCLKISSYRSIG